MSSGFSGSRWTRAEFWGMIGGVFAVIGVVVAIAVPVLQSDDSPGPQAASAGPTSATPATEAPLPTAETTSPIGADVRDGDSESIAPTSSKIQTFAIFPNRTNRLVGEHQFQTAGPTIQLSFVWDVKSVNGGDIGECTITSTLTYLDEGRQDSLSGLGHCPSRSTSAGTKEYLNPGNYKLVSTAYVQSTGESAQAEYDFSVVPG